MYSIIAWEKLLHSTSSSRFALACYFSSFLCHSAAKSLLHPKMEPLGTEDAEKWRRGVSLKGIITVSPEEVHNHSVKQTGLVREKSTSGFLPESQLLLDEDLGSSV